MSAAPQITDDKHQRDAYDAVAWGILLVAAAFRLAAGALLSLNNDELSAVIRCRYPSFGEMIREGVYIDFHPAGVQSFLYYWIKIAGDGPFAIRLPFILCGIASSFLIYKIGKRWFHSLVGLLGAAAFSTLSFTVLYSVFARPYSPGLLFCLLATWHWTGYLFGNDRRSAGNLRDLAGFGISLALCLHIHYFSFVFAAVLGLWGILFAGKKKIRPYLFTGLLALITFLPEWKIFSAQMSTGDIGGWLGMPPWYFFSIIYYHVFNRSVLLTVAVTLFLVISLLWGRKTVSLNRFYLLAPGLFAAVYLIAYFYSLLRHPVIQYSTLFFAVPFLLLFIFSFVPVQKISIRRGKWLTAVVVLVFSAHTVFAVKIFSRAQFGVFREVATDVSHWMSTAGTECLISVINPEYINYYFKREEGVPPYVLYPYNDPLSLVKVREMADTSHAEEFCFAWTNSASAWEINQFIREKFPYLQEQHTYFNAETFLYTKNASGKLPDFVWRTVCDYESDKWGNESSLREQGVAHSGSYAELLDSSKEYSQAFLVRAQALKDPGYHYASVKAWFLADDSTLTGKLVLSVDHDGESLLWGGADLEKFNIHPGRWQQLIFSVRWPDALPDQAGVKVFFWNKDHRRFYVDDLSFEVERGRDPYDE